MPAAARLGYTLAVVEMLANASEESVAHLCCVSRCPRRHTQSVHIVVGGVDRYVRVCDRHAQHYRQPPR